MPSRVTLSVQRGRPQWGQGLRAARAAQELPQPPKTANVEILGGHLAGASHGSDELSAAIHRPEWGVVLRGIGLQLLKLKRLALPGDGSLMVAHWPGPEEGRSCRTEPLIMRCGTRVDNRRKSLGGGGEADSHPNLGTPVVASASSYSALAAESGGGSALAAESGGGSAEP